jgi:hypothetical protein
MYFEFVIGYEAIKLELLRILDQLPPRNMQH